jgi:hypothetical protein
MEYQRWIALVGDLPTGAHRANLNQISRRQITAPDALSGQSFNLSGLCPGRWGSSFVIAPALGFGNALCLAFKHDFALELGDCIKEIEHQHARGRARVDIHGENLERYSFLFELSDD